MNPETAIAVVPLPYMNFGGGGGNRWTRRRPLASDRGIQVQHDPQRGTPDMAAGTSAKRIFELILIKPSHYDDDGYVIQWLRSAIPSNTLAVLYGLARDCAERHILGPDVEIAITAIDETNTRVRPQAIIRRIRRAGAGMVALVGVQSNQFPRAVDIARPLRDAGLQVGIGGFHVSGTIAMLPGLQPEVAAAQAMGISLFAGEAEGRLDAVLIDAFAGRLQPLYNFMDDLPNIEGVPMPVLPIARVRRTAGRHASFDAGRGSPFQCFRSTRQFPEFDGLLTSSHVSELGCDFSFERANSRGVFIAGTTIVR